MPALESAKNLYSSYNWGINLILALIMASIGWLFTSSFYSTELAIWLIDNSKNTFVGNVINPFPIIFEMLFRAFIPLFLATGIAFFLYSYLRESGANKAGYFLSIFAKGSIKTIQAFITTLIGGCSYILYHWERIHPYHTNLDSSEISGFKVVLGLLLASLIVCFAMKYASKIHFEELGDNPTGLKKYLKDLTDTHSKSISYIFLGLSLFISLLLPAYQLYDQISLVQEACAKDTKRYCDLPDFPKLPFSQNI